uniref:glycogenin glucosyltransferase n=1 Tax=Echeneis naucrates TaxID=173247 RepID=A0A665VND2_ECHNA
MCSRVGEIARDFIQLAEFFLAFVTLATNDSYAKGAMVLGQSLRNHNTTKKLVALIGPNVAEACREALASIFDEVRVVDVMDSGDSAHLALMKRPDLGVTFTKLHCWTLTQYSKCVFMDADTLVLSNIDELFEREELSAAPDPGWPDCFNSGVFVFRPSKETHERLLTFCDENGSFDGGDQGVLNSYFNTWATADISKHLPFLYNLSSVSIYSYKPAFKQYGHEAKVVHFLGKTKPWNYSYDPQKGEVRDHAAFENVSVGVAAVGTCVETNVHENGCERVCLSVAQLSCPDCVQASNQQVNSPLSDVWGINSKKKNKKLIAPASCDDSFITFFFSVMQAKPGDDVREQPADSAPPPTPPPPRPAQNLSSEERKQRWEAGQIDYLGDDAFANIKRKLDSFLK